MVCSTGDDKILQLRPKAKTDSGKAPTAFNASTQTAESSGYVLCMCFGNAVHFFMFTLQYGIIRQNLCGDKFCKQVQRCLVIGPGQYNDIKSRNKKLFFTVD